LSSVIVAGNVSGSVTLDAPAVSGSTVITLPTASGTMATLTTPSFTTTIGVGAATPSASGAGITFPATQSASTDANTLDDYEEGTWTPALRFGGNNAGMVVSIASASYTKIGRVVHVQFRFGYSTKGSSTGAAQIFGLPFPATGNVVGQGYSVGTYSFEGNGATTTVAGLYGLAWEDSTIYLRANAGTNTSFTQLTDSNFGTSTEFWGSIVYRTAS
jgi:hypothetical protein